METPVGKCDATRYCDYYQDMGNHTDECKALRDYIKRFIADGYLREYIAHHQRTQQNAPDVIA